MKKEMIEKIAEMAFYLGSEVNASNAPIIGDFINTLYEVREYLKSEEK